MKPAREPLATTGTFDNTIVAGWQLELSRHRIVRNGESRNLEPLLVKLLVRLLENANQVVSRQQLESALWPNTVAGYDTLSNTVSKLRKRLAGGGVANSGIETIPRTGYRVIVEHPMGDFTVAAQSIESRHSLTPRRLPNRSRLLRSQILAAIGIATLLSLTALLFQANTLPKIDEWTVQTRATVMDNNTQHSTIVADLVNDSWQNYLTRTPDGFIRAHHALQKAVKIDPYHVDTRALLAALYWEMRERDWGLLLKIGPEDLRNRTLELIQPLEVSDTTMGQLVSARVSARLGEFHSALRLASKAYERRLGDLESTYVFAEILLLYGDTKGARAILDNFELQPEIPNAGLLYLNGLAEFHRANYSSALHYLTKAAQISPAYPNPKILLAATNALLGQIKQADLYRQDIVVNLAYCLPKPDNIVMQFFPYRHPAHAQQLADGLRLAGL